MSNGIYLYGIFPPPGPQNLELEGLDKQPIQLQTIDGFAFLYSDAQQERYLASRKNLLGHEKVLEQAMQAGYRTLLPLQFGLIVENWETVSQQLTSPYGDRLKKLFNRLEGQQEVSVKVFWTQDTELQMLLNENQELREKRNSLEGKPLNMDQVVSIGQAIERAIESRKQSIINVFRQELTSLATEVVENDTLTESMIYNTAYLIPWEVEPEFSAQVEALDQFFNERLKIRYNNLTAPYNFAQLNWLD
ncbi:GvpL/GvpF family gas vesicle protein [Leptothermofonsia sp. ETS-13]|uniref:gas vesicle protein GvpF n=1 Tax=Leptothermofonsia sp. ETS-13 TaxID=3035696 RepID=UPI003B9F9CF0